MTYDRRRRHIRALINDLDASLAEVVRWTGRGEGRGAYQYVWQVLDGRKRSEAVLDDLEDALRDRGHWREPRSWVGELWEILKEG
jgi:hypothetical protein